METDEDEQALVAFMESIEQAHAMDRSGVRSRAAELFDTERVMDAVITSLDPTRLSGGAGRGPNGKANATTGDKGGLTAEMCSR